MSRGHAGGEPEKASSPHPRDTVITIYGRKPLLEALSNEGLQVRKVFVADRARGPHIEEILRYTKHRNVELVRAPLAQVNRISRNARQDQGVAADIINRNMRSLDTFLSTLPPNASARVLALDNITTPANIGMILRSVTALGWHGIVLPRKGCPKIGPLVIKASAGTALQAPVLRTARTPEALQQLTDAGFTIYGLGTPGGKSLADAQITSRAVFVLGNETLGVSPESTALITRWLHIPMAPGIDSLNVACAAAIVCHTLRPA